MFSMRGVMAGEARVLADGVQASARAEKGDGKSDGQGGGKDGGKDDAKSRYRATLNLPSTNFAMKANLVQNEPASLKRWQAMGLYERVRKSRAGAKKFTFHDGPPYANGSIHLGHLMNKCLKDFVVRSRTMAGYDTPYVPGWDCHGLPIEHKVMTELQEKGKLAKLSSLGEDQRKVVVRRECQAYAEKYVELHKDQMQRLLTLADYEHPYLTMLPAYEGATLEVLAGLMEQGLVYRQLKPVHWSPANETALAEAELEYQDREDPSVYVDFEAEDGGAVYDAFGLKEDVVAEDAEEEQEEVERAERGDAPRSKAPKAGTRPLARPSFMIWTTTPWTLAANLAIAVNPQFEYALVWVDGNVCVMARDAVERVTKRAKSEEVSVLATARGDRLVGLRYRHPFVKGTPSFPKEAGGDASRCYRVVGAEYVTLDDGTGLVHTAPGHGAEDYQTGLREGLPVYCPVKGDGTYDASVPEWLRGMAIWEANTKVVEHLRASGHMFFDHVFTHSYPHDWRSKTPVIFRSTEQWFVGVERAVGARGGASLRDMALAAVDAAGASSVAFVPEWGRNRMRGMLESRPDWCISRQRAWGLPIPAFFVTLADGSEVVLMTPSSVRAVARVFREVGSDAWFTKDAAELLEYYDAGADNHAPAAVRADPTLARGARKGNDILDVWFESGSSWNAVMRERGLGFPADLYLEGSDQHRGWFQLSLLPALGVTGQPPFKTLLTHGFMVDRDGRKLSKSRPDAHRYEVDSLCAEFGMDVMRWWVSSLAYENDVKVDVELFALAGESYRKVRNTLRFMLSNLADFTASTPGMSACESRDQGRTPGSESRGTQGAGHCVALSSLAPTSLEAWVLGEFDAMAKGVALAYERYDFQAAHKAVFDFCNSTLSATYLAAVKDRLYCDRKDSPRRRATQTVLWDLVDGLCRLLAPVMCHTADEAYRTLHRVGNDDRERCVHLEEWPDTTTTTGWFGVARHGMWPSVMAEIEKTRVALERAKAGGIENPLDAGLVLRDGDGVLREFDAVDLADLLGVSLVKVEAGAGESGGGEASVLDLRDQPRCERSWKRDGTVRVRADGGMLSDRDAEAVGGDKAPKG
jgi:isoleucyl-tRNA synthetase